MLNDAVLLPPMKAARPCQVKADVMLAGQRVSLSLKPLLTSTGLLSGPTALSIFTFFI